MSKYRPASIALLIVALVACDRLPTGTAAKTEVQADFLNGPDELPNVFRYEGHSGFAVRDVANQLVVVAGLPANPADLTLCGGTIDFQPVAVQTTGELRGIFTELRIGTDLRIHVWDLHGFRNQCVSTPFAVGSGRAIREDNDVDASLTRGNSFGTRINGSVTDAAGQQYHVLAAIQQIILPNGTFKTTVRAVHLVPVGQ